MGGLKMIIEYIKYSWDQHFAAATGTGASLLNGGHITESVIVGVLVFSITNIIKYIIIKIIKNKCIDKIKK